MVNFEAYTKLLEEFNSLFLQEREKALDYLHSRHFYDSDISKFSLGFCPFLNKERFTQFSQDLLQESKMFNDVSCIFENRLMFPVKNADGKIVSFCGRALEQNPFKYLNKPDCIFTSRDFNLYGIDLAIRPILEMGYVYIVEGLFDVIRMHSIGFTNTVGLFGTRISNEQLAFLRCLTDNLIILLDGDAAGLVGAQEINHKALVEGFKTCLITLPDGQDPDSFILNTQRDEVLSILNMPYGRDFATS